MKDPLRNFLDKIKPSFQGKGGLSYYFPIFDVIENLFYSSDKKTKGLTHVRDGSDIQRIMVVVWPHHNHNPLDVGTISNMS